MIMTHKDLIKMLEKFSNAWNAHDADALMVCMTEDCVFYASGGPAKRGAEYRGTQSVMAAYAAIWERFPDARWNNSIHFASGDRAVSEWVFTGTTKDGQRIESCGCDLFVIKGGKIAVKDSYRKQQ